MLIFLYDMELCEHTDYSSPLNKVDKKGVGFILTNWARNEKLMLAKVPRKRHEYVKQIFCYQGGGMVYNNEIADIMRKLKQTNATFDHEWSLTSYLNGYINYRYLGSLAIHKIMSKGGMNQFMAENEAVLPLKEYINFRKAKKQRGNGLDYLIPLDKDLKTLAKQLHEKRRIHKEF